MWILVGGKGLCAMMLITLTDFGITLCYTWKVRA